MGKLFAFSAAVDADMTWLVIVGVIATAVSVYYYLAIVRSLYMRTELRLVPAGGAPPREIVLTISVALTLGIVISSFVFVQPLLDLAGNAASSLGF
jgi:NADH-quinone oxidoreductase subunit N